MARGRKRKAGDTRSFGQFKKEQGLPPANRPISQSTAGSGYQAGSDSITNYSPADQQKIFDFVGGKDKFIEEASGIVQKYPRGTDIQKFLDRINLYNQGIMAGGTISEDATGLERLNLVNKGVKNPETGATILSLTRPQLTAQAPTIGELVQDFGRGAGNVVGAIGEKALSGGVTGELLQFIKDKYEGGKQKLNQMINPPSEQINPLFNITEFDPIKVSDMDSSRLMADNTVLDGILQNYNRIRNFGTDMGLDRFKFDPLNPDRGVDFQDTFIFNETPVDYNIGIDPSGTLRFGLGFDY